MTQPFKPLAMAMAVVLFSSASARDMQAQTLAGAKANQKAIDDLQISIARFGAGEACLVVGLTKIGRITRFDLG